MRYAGWLAVLFVAASAEPPLCTAQNPADAAARAIRPAALQSHLEFLASDALEGRGTGTRGGRLAASYIAAQFERLGLEPAGDSGTYFQAVPLVMRSYSSTLSDGAGSALAAGTDFVAYSTGAADSTRLSGGVVFVGYGITAPEAQWDDYAGADVSGKIVLALAGTPADQDSSLFHHAGRPDYGFRQYKVDQAMRHGASAAFVVYRSTYPVPWSELSSGWTGEQPQLAESRSVPLRVAGWINTPAASRLLRQAGEDLERLAAAAGQPGFRAKSLNLELTVSVRAHARPAHSTNVLARLTGQRSRGEAVVLGAHYDHLGIGAPVEGDSIYNGAIDNASGTAALLAIAEACVISRLTPARSIIFAAFGAEELGLLGSEAFVRQPPVPLSRLAAMLNLDGVNLIGETRDIAALGADWSSLGSLFERAARAEGYSLTPRDSPIMQEAARQDFFNRSDQASFARAGVPALFLYFGDQMTGAEAGSGKQQLDDYLAHRYHRPNDDLNQRFDYDAATHSLRVLARTLVAAANAPDRPTWNPGAPYTR